MELLTLERVSPEPCLVVGARDAQGGRIYAGNFERISHAFSITTDENILTDRLVAAIRVSQKLESDCPVTDRAWELMRDGLASNEV